MAILLPIEIGIHDNALAHSRRPVSIIALHADLLAIELVRENGLTPIDGSADRLRVRIDEKLGGIETETVARVPRSVYPKAIELTGLESGDETVVHEGGDLS